MKSKRVQAMHRLGLVMGSMLATAMASAQPDCRDVRIVSEKALNMGTIRAQPETRGFMELDPRHGISVSARGISHSGPFGAARQRVSGPAGMTVTLLIEPQRTSRREHSRMSLVEIIARSGALNQRLSADGSELRLELPSSGNAEGIAQRRIEFGAVMRFDGVADPEQAQYRLMSSCVRAR